MTAGRRADSIPHVPFKEKPTLLDAVVSEARDADSEHGDDDHQR
jgi:hypothetical protein